MRLPSSFVIQRVSIFPLLSMVLPVVLAANWCTSRVYASHPVRSQVQIEEPLEEAGTYSIKITKGTRITNSGTMQPYTIERGAWSGPGGDSDSRLSHDR
jgi:hypothetical protein